MKWYTFNDGGAASDAIDMILDHNTTAVVAWNISGNNTAGPTDVLTQLQNDTVTWSNTLTVASSNNIVQQTNSSANTYTLNYTGYKARLITADEVATITANTTWTQADISSTNYFLDTKNTVASPTCTTGDTSNFNYDWLYDRTSTDCTTFGCLNNADASMTGNGYWTSSANNLYPAYAWIILKKALFNLLNSLIIILSNLVLNIIYSILIILLSFLYILINSSVGDSFLTYILPLKTYSLELFL